MKIRSSKRICLSIAIFCLIFLAFTQAAAAGVITVDDNGGEDYASIQAAVNNANDGDTIVVYPGTYIENVKVNKSVAIISGNPDDTNVRAANPDDDVFYVTADDVKISGFNIIGANTDHPAKAQTSSYNTGYPNAGLYFDGVEGCIITNNSLSDNIWGIALAGSINNELNANIALNNQQGVVLVDSLNNTLSNNTASNNIRYGIYLLKSNSNTLSNNTANSNKVDGIFLWKSNNNTLNGNSASSNNRGIYLYSSINNELSNNLAKSNTDYGIFLFSSSNNLIYNNYFDNMNNVGFYEISTGNICNITKTEDTSITGGPYLGGNYWSTPDGKGFSQTCIDADGDGICDSPYIINENNIDYLPLSDMNAEFNPLMYDDNSNGGIDKDEIFDAIKDYFGNKITKDDVFEVIKEYFR